MSFDQNPYASFSSTSPIAEPKNLRLADLGKRFLGALVDGLVSVAFIGPGYGVMIAGSVVADQAGLPSQPGPLVFVGLALIVLGGLALLGIQIFLAVTRSQSIGKFFLKTQIVDFRNRDSRQFRSVFFASNFRQRTHRGCPMRWRHLFHRGHLFYLP